MPASIWQCGRRTASRDHMLLNSLWGLHVGSTQAGGPNVDSTKYGPSRLNLRRGAFVETRLLSVLLVMLMRFRQQHGRA